jgi:protein TonB
MNVDQGAVHEPVAWPGNRNFIVPPDIVAVPRRSPLPKRKRTECKPRPEGEAVCRAGNREWFSDHLFADEQTRDLRATCGTSFTAHASCVVGFLLLLAGPTGETPVRVSTPMRMPVFVATLSGGAGSAPALVSRRDPPIAPAPAAVPPRRAEILERKAAANVVTESKSEALPVAAADDEPATSEPVQITTDAAANSGAAGGNLEGAGHGGDGNEGVGTGSGSGTGSGRGGVGMSPGPYRVGNGIEPPRKIKDVRPVYPATALTRRAFGTVLVEAVVGADGKVHDVRILHSIAELDQAALDAVRQWEFAPSTLNGIPIAVVVTIVVQFAIH